TVAPHALNRCIPAGEKALPLPLFHLRLEIGLAAPLSRDVVERSKKPGLQSSEVGGTERRRLWNFRPINPDIEDVGEELQHPIVGDHASIYPQAPRFHAIFSHGIEEIAGLVDRKSTRLNSSHV